MMLLRLKNESLAGMWSLFQNVFYPIPSLACAARFVSIFALRDSSLVFLPAILGTPFSLVIAHAGLFVFMILQQRLPQQYS